MAKSQTPQTGRNKPQLDKRSSGSRSAATRSPQSTVGRQSVAAARKGSSSNRSQLIIGGVALLLIVAVIVVGLVLNKKNNAVQADGYGDSKASTASVAAGVITISSGTPSKSIDIFEDAMCPVCGQFEHQFGQQLAQSADQGKLTIRLHMLNFLNKSSSSGDYSTRAAGALLAVATEAGDQPGMFLKFHTAIFADGTQPEENSNSDLSNAQLADVAKKAGIPDSVVASITAGKYAAAAATNAAAGETAISAAVGSQWGTPTVLNGGKAVVLNSTDWLTNLLAA